MRSWRHRCARFLGWLSGAALLFMMLFTTYAVIRRELFDAPVLGVVDIMELALVTCVFTAIAAVFLRDEHIVVDVIDQIVSKRFQSILRCLATIISLVLLVTMTVEMVPAAFEKYSSGEVTMTLSFNRFLHWMPILLCFFVSIVAVLWILSESWQRSSLDLIEHDRDSKQNG